MQFNSHVFLLLFLPITLMVWYLLNHYEKYKTAKAFLAGMSLWFYAYFNYSYLIIILCSIVGNRLISIWMEKTKSRNWQCFQMLVGIFYNLSFLFYFKYYDFFIENLNTVFQSDFTLQNILLPLGISFFTFQQLSYMIDRYRGSAPHYAFLDYVNFVTFFPQLVAGPIVTHQELVPQFQSTQNKHFQVEMFTKGVIKFVLGFGKKILLADILALVVNYGFEKIYYLDTVSALVVVVFFAFQLYFDFSGYSDMAVGLGNMFGISLPTNFQSPYLAGNVQEFWKRWHITLNRFFVQYVYIPLGGSRVGKGRMFLNTLLVFSLSGLWHGANWTFVIWGLLNGVVAGINQLGYLKCKNKKIGAITTFLFFSFTLIFFKSESLQTALLMLQKIFVPSYSGFVLELAGALKLPELYLFSKAAELYAKAFVPYIYLIAMAFLGVISSIIIRKKTTIEIAENQVLSRKLCVFCTLVFVWSFLSLSQVSTFLYFNF